MNSTLEQSPCEIPKPVLSTRKSRIFPASHSLLGHQIHHHPKSGLNPVADAAGSLFSIIGKLKQLDAYPDTDKLHADLIDEINTFYETVKNHGYSTEYSIVCRYIMCATLDEIINHDVFEGNGEWEAYSLLAAFKQDAEHQEKFFTILERILKEPALYIDLMELMYLSLSMEYKGRYRKTEDGQHQLEQITNTLYKHIRTYRGSFSKTLTPTPLKLSKTALLARSKNKTSLRSIFIVTVCVILTILISLGYLMDVIANEPYQNVHQSEHQT